MTKELSKTTSASHRTTVLQVLSANVDVLKIILDDLLRDVPNAEFITITVERRSGDERSS